jgi:hypothetical protein
MDITYYQGAPFYETFSGSVINNAFGNYTEVPRVKNVVSITSASYASLITRDPNTLYVVTGSQHTSGTSGTSGVNGTSGDAGSSGTSGNDGVNGTNGTGGSSGTSGVSGAGFPYTGSATITGSLEVDGPITIISGAFDGDVIDNVNPDAYTTPKVKHVIAITSASYAALGTKDPNTLYVVSGSAITGSGGGSGDGFPYVGKAEITGSVDVSGSYLVTSGSYTGSLIDNVNPNAYDVPEVKHVISITSASYAALGTKDANTLYVVSGSAITGSGGAGGDAFPYTGEAVITGSLRGNVTSLSVASTTASMDLSVGNFFTLTLPAATTHITATNIQPGQTTNLLVTSQAGASVDFPSTILQPSGSFFTASNASTTDVLTFVSWDGTNLYLVGLNNFN